MEEEERGEAREKMRQRVSRLWRPFFPTGRQFKAMPFTWKAIFVGKILLDGGQASKNASVQVFSGMSA